MKTILQIQVELLEQKVIEMAITCEDAINQAIKALKTNNTTLAKNTISYDSHINDLNQDIQALGYSLFIRQQPVASDFRFISSSLNIINDLERIGDYAANICEIIIEASNLNLLYKNHLDELIKHVIIILNKSVKAIVNKDKDLALEIIEYDDIIDEGLKKIKRILSEDIFESKRKRIQMLDTYMLAKYFERCGDKCVNIANNILLINNEK